MSFQVSPGVDSREVDQTNIVPAIASSVGAYAGHFNWGPVDEVVTLGSEKELAEQFGAPTKGSATARSFLTAASFLKYSNALRVARAIGTGALNSADTDPVLIKNKEHFDSLTGLDFTFAARSPGALGDSILVSLAYVTTDGDSSYDEWDYKTLFSSVPNQSLTAAQNSITTNDEINLVVVDALGLITGTKGSILEKYEGLSLGANARSEDGGSLYYKDVINNTSSYIYVNTLGGIFEGADEDITEDTVFSVIGSAVNQISSLVLPFDQIVSTTTQIGAGAPVVTETRLDTPITVKSGLVGEIGNFAKINVRLVDSGSTPTTTAHGFIKYGAPVNGDTVTVGETVLTKASTGGAATFSSISQLEALIEAIPEFTSQIVGEYILISAASAGAVGNTYALELGSNNAGTMEVSGTSLANGRDAEDDAYLDISIDDLSPSTGFITWDISVGTGTRVVGPTTFNDTSVSLADIIAELEYQRVALNNSAVPALTFFSGTAQVSVEDDVALASLDIQALLPYSASAQEVLEVLPFSGGEAIAYNLETLLTNLQLIGGNNGSIVPGNVVTALEHFSDAETILIDFLFAENFEVGDQSIIDSKLYEIANGRKDILATISAPLSIATLSSNTLKKQANINKFDGAVYTSSSFVAFDQTPVYTYNKFADSYHWIPACGHVAGLCANADLVADPWFSPAGFNRGQLKGVIKIAYNPTRTDRDELYAKRINFIVSMPGQGIVLYGDRTALTKPSAFDRINVRRLFNVLKRAIGNAARFQLFELNDEFTRVAFKNTIEPFLRDVQGRRGVTEFLVVCDETNNTPEVIDGNDFVGDIYVKPSRSINNIQLNFIATRTGIDFREIVGS